jgi:hypothetical protein
MITRHEPDTGATKPRAGPESAENGGPYHMKSQGCGRHTKVAARVIETATRVRVAFAASCPEAELFGSIARWLQPAET